jgi:hypothetical protein
VHVNFRKSSDAFSANGTFGTFSFLSTKTVGSTGPQLSRPWLKPEPQLEFREGKVPGFQRREENDEKVFTCAGAKCTLVKTFPDTWRSRQERKRE